MNGGLDLTSALGGDLASAILVYTLAAQAVMTVLLLLLLAALIARSRAARRTAEFAPGATIDSPLRSYVLESQLAEGDVCDVFLASLAVVGVHCNEYVVKVPRAPREHALLETEYRLLTRLVRASGDDRYRDYLPRPVESFRCGARRINVFGFRPGCYTAEEIRAQHPAGVDGRHVAWMFKRTLEVLGFVHQQGWLHGAVLPPHLLFDVQNHGLVLAGWIHAERLHQPLRFAPQRFKHWYPPECAQRRPATPSVDIYLAAMSMLYLAGGDPQSKRMPDHVPVELRRFLESCLGGSPRTRPQDAWQLHEDFTRLLERVYGPPAFYELPMS
jgi:hypothetical protein